MTKILFVIPPNISYDKFLNPGFNERSVTKKSGRYGSPITDMPLGVMSLSAYLKKNSRVKTQLIDFNIVLNKLDEFNYNSFSLLFCDLLSPKSLGEFIPDIISISTLFTTGYYNMIDIANAARKLYPKSLIIAGGGVPTNLYKRIFSECQSFDAFCFGEGEKPLLGLVKAKNRKKFFQKHKSWITKDKIKKNVSFEYDHIDNLDEIPLFDYGILESDAYMLSPTLTNYATFENDNHLFHYMTSRGCPFHCCFCASHTVHGRKMRYLSLNRVKKDLTILKKKFGAKIINFQDDNLLIDKDRAYKIIDFANSKLKLQLYFQNGLAMRSLDKKILTAMKKAGVTSLVLPIESGSDRILKEIMHKPSDLSIARQVVANCRELGLDTDVNILIGLPGETKKDIEEARKFLILLDANWFRVVVATPLVGSEMHKICVENNYIDGDDIGCDYKNAVVSTKDFSAKYIVEKAYLLNLEINFVRNSDMKLGNYKKALERFENTINVKNDHAFAYYFAAKCHKKLGQKEKYKTYRKKYQEIIKKSALWRNYAKKFKLSPLR